MTRMQSLLLLAMSWTAWCFLHSFLISRTFADMMKKKMGRRYAYYRMAYNIISLVFIIPVILFQLSLREKIFFPWPWPWSLVKFALYGAAFLLLYGGGRVYDIQYMLGIRQIHGMKSGSRKVAMGFTTAGILGYVRHPWYSGAILLVWAYGPITDVSLVSKVVLTGYLIIGTLLEEKKLLAEFGEQYRQYRKTVPMYLPWKMAKRLF